MKKLWKPRGLKERPNPPESTHWSKILIHAQTRWTSPGESILLLRSFFTLTITFSTIKSGESGPHKFASGAACGMLGCPASPLSAAWIGFSGTSIWILLLDAVTPSANASNALDVEPPVPWSDELWILDWSVGPQSASGIGSLSGSEVGGSLGGGRGGGSALESGSSGRGTSAKAKGAGRIVNECTSTSYQENPLNTWQQQTFKYIHNVCICTQNGDKLSKKNT